jgi:hypothetical protein
VGCETDGPAASAWRGRWSRILSSRSCLS